MTDAELAILSLLYEGPSLDHDLNSEIEARGLRRWTAIGSSSMYYVLDKLERQGLVELVSEEHGQRKFAISAAGLGVLQTSVADLLSTPHARDKSFELGLANLHVLKPNQVRSALLSRQQDLIMQIAKLREERQHVTGNFQIDSMFGHGIEMREAELVWLEKFIIRWEAQAPAEPVRDYHVEISPRMKQVVLPQDPDSVHKETTIKRPASKKATQVARRTMGGKKPPKDE